MTDIDVHKSIGEEIGALFTCSRHGDFIRIRTPYLYPDGDYIDLFHRRDGNTTTVTDLAETTGWLWTQSSSPRRSPKQIQLVEDSCITHGVELYRGMLLARQGPGEPLAALVTRVAQAALRVSDLWFTFRTRAAGESIADRVAAHLADHELPFERAETLAGRSGRGWRVDFHVRARRRSSLVYVLSTASKAMGRQVAEHTLAGWYDLNHLAAGPEALQFVSLFDDTIDVWTQADFRMLGELSTVCRWARPEEFIAVLSGAP